MNTPKVNERSCRTNHLINGLGNGVLNLVNNAAVRLHVRRAKTEVIERTISEQEIPHQVGRLDLLRAQFVNEEHLSDPLALITSQMIDTAIEAVRQERINPEAAMDSLAVKYEKEQVAVLGRLEEESEGFRSEIAGLSINGVQTSSYGRLEELDRRVLSHRDNYLRRQMFLRDLVGLMDSMIDTLHSSNGEQGPAEVVHVANALSWPEITRLFAAGAKGFILNSELLGPINHPFIFSHNNSIPLVVVRNPLELIDLTCRVSVDSRTGQVVLNPSEATVEALARRQERYRTQAKMFKEQFKRQQSLDDQPLPQLQANIKDRYDIDHLKASEVGLFRTEGLYDEGPCRIQTMIRIFKSAISKSQAINIRLFDLASDKMPPFIAESFQGTERGVSFLLWTPVGKQILIDQLKAVLIAAERLLKGKTDELTGKQVRLIIPMVSDPVEVREVKKIMAEVEADLLARDLISELIAGKLILGAMIETRQAVANVEQLASEVSYFSIGSNDLTMDLLGFNKRTKLMTGPEYDWLAPVVINGIKQVISAAQRHNIPVCSCGEISRDPLAAIVLTVLGIDSLSMDESYRQEINYVLSNIHLREWASFTEHDPGGLPVVDRLLTLTDALQVRNYLFDLIKNRTHADSRLALETAITAARPLTYQEPAAI